MRKLLFLLLCLLALQQNFAQSISVRGKVTDKNGSPLADASVTILQSRVTTSTAADGSFEIKALHGSKITISRAGFKTQTFIASPAELAAVLEEDMARLEEVVVTGLATTVKRRNAANAVATVSAKDLTGTAPAQTLDAGLNGKIAGANIVANSGAPGGGVTIKFRGVSTVYGNTQPLFVIDGIIVNNKAISGGMNIITQAQNNGDITSDQDNAPNRIADINPDEIENIEILKGASAAALYGSQAAAGVILITTKKGKAGRTRISVSQDLGVLSARRFIGARPLSEAVVQSESTWDPDEYKAAVAAGKIYDYEKEVYGNKGFIRNSRITFSGGSDKTSFLFSAGMRKENGIVKRTGYENSSLRLNIDHRVSDRVKLGFSSSYTNSSTDRGITNNDNKGVTLGVALSSTPNFTELHADAGGVYPVNIYGASNPLETRDVMTNNELNNRFITGTTFEAILQQSATSTTRVSGRAGLDYYSLKSSLQFPAFMQFEKDVANGHNVQGNAGSLFTNWAAFLVNNFKPSDQLSFVTTAGLTHEYGKFDQIVNVATQLIGTQTSVDQAAALTALQVRNSFRNDGFFAQEEFAFNDYLNLTAAVRFDRSTNNGDHKKLNAYPKAGLAWNISKMRGWNSEVISDLKLRVAYGESGNFPTFNSRFISLPSIAIGGRPGSLISRTLGNPDINAERQTELEAGIDIALFKGRVSLEASYYNKLIKDLLLLSSPPGSSGFATEWVNGGRLRNRGVELGLKTVPVNTKGIVWNSNINFWKNTSKVVSLNVPAFDPGGNFGKDFGQFLIEEGQTATQIVGNNEKVAGLVKIGDTEPDFQASWFNDLSLFNNLSLRFLMHWKKGGDNVNLTQALYDFGHNTVDYDEIEENGKKASRNRLAALGSGAPYVQDATYLRIREIGLYYKLPIQSKVVQGIRVGASLNNFFTWTKYKGYDPEVSNFGTAFSTGIDVAPYPASKRVQFHLSFDF
jgi:TonB-linked SusC/RagA family outer membrane protein